MSYRDNSGSRRNLFLFFLGTGQSATYKETSLVYGATTLKGTYILPTGYYYLLVSHNPYCRSFVRSRLKNQLKVYTEKLSYPNFQRNYTGV